MTHTVQALSVSIKWQGKVSRQVRDEIVLDHMPLVKAIAIRVHENLPVHVDLDDLIHAGVLGLFDAVEKYDDSKNVEFHSYAKHRIKGAILDSLRQSDWASRDLRKRQKQVETVTRDLAAKLGRHPSGAELADQLGVSVEQWRRLALELRNVAVVSTTQHPDQERDTDLPATTEFQPDRMCERHQMKIVLSKVIGKLPARYQKVVLLYYTKDMTMKEIGGMLGVNESRISQIHKTALKKMAVVLQSEGIHSAGVL